MKNGVMSRALGVIDTVLFWIVVYTLLCLSLPPTHRLVDFAFDTSDYSYMGAPPLQTVIIHNFLWPFFATMLLMTLTISLAAMEISRIVRWHKEVLPWYIGWRGAVSGVMILLSIFYCVLAVFSPFALMKEVPVLWLTLTFPIAAAIIGARLGSRGKS